MKDIPPLSDDAKALKPGIYRHFKGGLKRFLYVARDSETEQELVIYQSLGSDDVWARPLAMFIEDVDRDGYHGPRFRWERKDSRKRRTS